MPEETVLSVDEQTAVEATAPAEVVTESPNDSDATETPDALAPSASIATDEVAAQNSEAAASEAPAEGNETTGASDSESGATAAHTTGASE